MSGRTPWRAGAGRAGSGRRRPRGSGATSPRAGARGPRRPCGPRGRSGSRRRRRRSAPCRAGSGAWPSTCEAPSSRELGQFALEAGDDSREIHHLGEPDHARAPHQTLQVSRRERAPRRLELRRRHARRRHEEDVQRQVGTRVEQPVHAVRAEHVGDLVRVGDDARSCRAAARGARTRRAAASATPGGGARRRSRARPSDRSRRSSLSPRSRRCRRRSRRRSRRRPRAIPA